MTQAGTGAARFPSPGVALSAVTYLIELTIIGAAYFSVAESTLLLPAINLTATPVWPPTGVALAFVLLRGYRVVPAILVSSFFAGAVSSGMVTTSWLLHSTFIAVGTTLAALAGGWLINYWSHGTKTFCTPIGIGWFVLVAFAPMAMMSSTSAVLGQLSTSDLNLYSLIDPSVIWWLVDAATTILVAPVIVLWAIPPRHGDARWDLLETTAILAASALIGAIAFLPVTSGSFNELLSQQRQFSFLILLPLIWAGLRGNQRAAATAALIFCGLAAWSLTDAGGSPAMGLNGSLLFLLTLSISTSVASLLLGAVIMGYRYRQEGAKRRFQIFVESVSDYAIFALDPSGRVASWNSTAQKIIGYTSEEIVGKHFSIFYRPDEGRTGVPIRALELAVQKGRHEVEGWRTRKDGTPFFVTGVLTAIHDENAKLIGFASVVRDATERLDTQEKLVEAREQLAMAQKMEAIGKLTGGIAHDFNNLLMIIGGNAQMFKRLLDPKLPRAIEAIQTAAKRGESLTRQLLTFSRRQHLKPTVIDLNASIRNMRPMIESSLRGNIIYKEKLGPALWPVKIDLAELQLAIVNIAVNARDAMPNGGVFTVSADNVTANKDVDQNRQSADFVAVQFSDSGSGIPSDLLSKIFDPFFTTKDVGKGTGLGLSQVYGFAHQAGGTVRAESQVGRGTTITIFLPASADAKVDVPETSRREGRHLPRPIVLIVDDSTEVAEVTSALFEQLGYETIYRDSAEAALNLLGNGPKIDLVFSDIVMPGPIDGVGLASEVRSLYPHLPVVLTTGYSDAAQAVPPNLPILRKPFDTDALRSFMHDMMDAG